MKDVLHTLRHVARWPGPVLGLMLLLGTLALGVHQHRDVLAQGHCVACTAAHSSAITPDAASPTTTPFATDERLALASASLPRTAPPAATSPRAPPLG